MQFVLVSSSEVVFDLGGLLWFPVWFWLALVW